MLDDLRAHVEAGRVRPLPMKVFEMRRDVVQAFRWLQGVDPDTCILHDARASASVARAVVCRWQFRDCLSIFRVSNSTKKLDDPVMHQPREPCEMYPYFSPKLCNLPCELLYLRLKTAPDDGVDRGTERPLNVDFQKMKKRREKSRFRAKIEKWEQRYGGKQLRRMNKETQNVKYLKGVNFFSQ